MLAFRRLLARKVPALRFCSSDYNWKDFDALSIDDQIEEINKREEHLSGMMYTCARAISEKSEAVQKVFRETKKVPFKYDPQKSGYLSKVPDVNIMLEALEKWEDLKDVPQIDDCASGTPDEAKILKAMETWEDLKNGFEEYYGPMQDVEEDLKLVTAVRIMQARVNDVKKQLGNDEE